MSKKIEDTVAEAISSDVLDSATGGTGGQFDHYLDMPGALVSKAPGTWQQNGTGQVYKEVVPGVLTPQLLSAQTATAPKK
jgi:hypothetical protein